MVSAQSGIIKDIEPDQVVGGTYAMPQRDWLKVQAVLPKLPELKKTDSSFYNCLLRNKGDGTFEDIAISSGAGYDENGNMTTLTDPAGNKTTYVFNNLDQQINEVFLQHEAEPQNVDLAAKSAAVAEGIRVARYRYV
jgi:YD repeat-containing protein